MQVKSKRNSFKNLVFVVPRARFKVQLLMLWPLKGICRYIVGRGNNFHASIKGHMLLVSEAAKRKQLRRLYINKALLVSVIWINEHLSPDVFCCFYSLRKPTFRPLSCVHGHYGWIAQTESYQPQFGFLLCMLEYSITPFNYASLDSFTFLQTDVLWQPLIGQL